MDGIHFSINEIAEVVNGTIIGNKNLIINNLASIENAGNGDLSFIHKERYLKFLKNSQASGIIIDKKIKIPNQAEKNTFIIVDNAHQTFTILLDKFYLIDKFSKSGIEKPTYIHKSSKINNFNIRIF